MERKFSTSQAEPQELSHLPKAFQHPTSEAPQLKTRQDFLQKQQVSTPFSVFLQYYVGNAFFLELSKLVLWHIQLPLKFPAFFSFLQASLYLQPSTSPNLNSCTGGKRNCELGIKFAEIILWAWDKPGLWHGALSLFTTKLAAEQSF